MPWNPRDTMNLRLEYVHLALQELRRLMMEAWAAHVCK